MPLKWWSLKIEMTQIRSYELQPDFFENLETSEAFESLYLFAIADKVWSAIAGIC